MELMKVMKTLHVDKKEKERQEMAERVEKHKKELAKVEQRCLKHQKDLKHRICRLLSQREKKAAKNVGKGSKRK